MVRIVPGDGGFDHKRQREVLPPGKVGAKGEAPKDSPGKRDAKPTRASVPETARKKNAKNSKVFEAFETFWDFVRRIEVDVRLHCNGPRALPQDYGDFWNEEFADAYERIRPYLGKYRRKRFFYGPKGVPSFAAPFTADNAHQALMFFLNGPEVLYGDAWVLDSAEYRAIKAEASVELLDRDKVRLRPSPLKDLPYCREAKILAEVSHLKAFLIDTHFPRDRKKEASLTTLSVREIAGRLVWSRSKASRRLARLFQCKEGKKAYDAVFSRKTTPRGYCQRFDDATLNVDGIVMDRPPDLDEPDAA